MKQFYCHLKNGKPEISEQKPENFDKLHYPYVASVPTPKVAKMAYQTKLKINWWRSGDGK